MCMFLREPWRLGSWRCDISAYVPDALFTTWVRCPRSDKNKDRIGAAMFLSVVLGPQKLATEIVRQVCTGRIARITALAVAKLQYPTTRAECSRSAVAVCGIRA
jgi:hypothetical protein